MDDWLEVLCKIGQLEWEDVVADLTEIINSDTELCKASAEMIYAGSGYNKDRIKNIQMGAWVMDWGLAFVNYLNGGPRDKQAQVSNDAYMSMGYSYEKIRKTHKDLQWDYTHRVWGFTHPQYMCECWEPVGVCSVEVLGTREAGDGHGHDRADVDVGGNEAGRESAHERGVSGGGKGGWRMI